MIVARQRPLQKKSIVFFKQEGENDHVAISRIPIPFSRLAARQRRAGHGFNHGKLLPSGVEQAAG